MILGEQVDVAWGFRRRARCETYGSAEIRISLDIREEVNYNCPFNYSLTNKVLWGPVSEESAEVHNEVISNFENVLEK